MVQERDPNRLPDQRAMWGISFGEKYPMRQSKPRTEERRLRGLGANFDLHLLTLLTLLTLTELIKLYPKPAQNSPICAICFQ